MECPICFSDGEEKIEKIFVEFPCKHKCCLDCFSSLKKFECMLCRKKLEHLVPDVLKRKNRSDAISSIIIQHVDHEYYFSLLGARLRAEILRTRVRRLQDMTEVPLLNIESTDDELD